jgi:hypothetical protein
MSASTDMTAAITQLQASLEEIQTTLEAINAKNNVRTVDLSTEVRPSRTSGTLRGFVLKSMHKNPITCDNGACTNLTNIRILPVRRKFDATDILVVPKSFKRMGFGPIQQLNEGPHFETFNMQALKMKTPEGGIAGVDYEVKEGERGWAIWNFPSRGLITLAMIEPGMRFETCGRRTTVKTRCPKCALGDIFSDPESSEDKC